MKDRYRLLIKAEGTADSIGHKSYDGDERLEVRDLITRCTTQVRAQEISCYRHILLVDGKAYQILDVARK